MWDYTSVLRLCQALFYFLWFYIDFLPFVWRKSVERNREKLLEKIRVLLQQINEQMAQDKAADVDALELTPQALCENSKDFKGKNRWPQPSALASTSASPTLTW